MSKHFAGIDIGSRTIELVLVDGTGKIVLSLQADTNFDPSSIIATIGTQFSGEAFQHCLPQVLPEMSFLSEIPLFIKYFQAEFLVLSRHRLYGVWVLLWC
jgi:hypothetical protein